MLVWVLVSLLRLGPQARGPGEFYLSARECELAEYHKPRPLAWACRPEHLPLDRN